MQKNLRGKGHLISLVLCNCICRDLDDKSILLYWRRTTNVLQEKFGALDCCFDPGALNKARTGGIEGRCRGSWLKIRGIPKIYKMFHQGDSHRMHVFPCIRPWTPHSWLKMPKECGSTAHDVVYPWVTVSTHRLLPSGRCNGQISVVFNLGFALNSAGCP
jgi:hypothetical protein